MVDRPGLGSPRGARELMPAASSRRQRVVNELMGEFEAWGYGRVETPVVEYYDVIARGLTEADRAQCVRFIEAGSGTVVALRADVTPQIARMVAGRIGGELSIEAVHRFCYAADVVRQPTALGETTEQHQVGVECLGDANVWSDVELIALCDAALCRVGLTDVSIDIAHAQLARTVIDDLRLDSSVRAHVQGRLARKDRSGAVAALVGQGVEPGLAAAVASLCDRIGAPSVVARAQAELGALLPSAIVGALAELVDAMNHYDAVLAAKLIVDLGETRGFDYYSGVRLRVWAPGVPRPIVRGGRYDAMLAKYGTAMPATGFAVDLDALEQALGQPGQGSAREVAGHMIAVEPRAGSQVRRVAARLAQRARAAGQRAWIQRADSSENALVRATEAGAVELTWITGAGETTHAQTSTREAGRWHSTKQWNEAP